MGHVSQLPSGRLRHADSLGCNTALLSRDQVLCAKRMTFRRKSAEGIYRARVFTPATDRGLLVGVALLDGHRRRIFSGSRHYDVHFNCGDIYIRDFRSEFRAEFDGPFDFFLIELQPDFLADEAALPCELRSVQDLARPMGVADPTLLHLVRALLPALAAPDTTDTLFMEQMSMIIAAHLLKTHPAQKADSKVVALPPVAIRRAQAMLVEADEEERLSIAAIASELGVSRNHFFVAFREATGVSPYQWLLNQRIDRARRLLRTTDLPLAQIAMHCGFSDQSHFTRIFGRIEGMSPGRWRERAR